MPKSSDTISKDTVVFSGFDAQTKEKSQTIINTFKQFIEDNKDELIALQIIYNKPYAKRHLTYQQIKEIAEAIEKPPYNLAPALIWHAYEQLEESKIRKAGSQKLLTDIISLIRFTIGESKVLEPFEETVNVRFNNWLQEHESKEEQFTGEQIEWLNLIKEHIAASLSMEMEDFEYAPFFEKGGVVKVYNLFGDKLNGILEELNEALPAA